MILHCLSKIRLFVFLKCHIQFKNFATKLPTNGLTLKKLRPQADPPAFRKRYYNLILILGKGSKKIIENSK